MASVNFPISSFVSPSSTANSPAGASSVYAHPLDNCLDDCFSFTKDVAIHQFKKHLQFLEINPEEINLEQTFEQAVVDWIVKFKSINHDELMGTFGFVSHESVDRFFNDKSIIRQLKDQVIFPEKRFSTTLFSDLQDTHEKLLNCKKNIDNNAQKMDAFPVIAALDIFSFIKRRSDEEIAIIEKYFKDAHIMFETYTSYQSLQTLKNDLNEMNDQEFESKYGHCMSGIFENFLEPLWHVENFYRWLERN